MTDKERPEARERSLDAGLLSIELDEHVKRLKEERAWQAGDRNAITLIKNSAVRVVLAALRGGASLREHRVEGPITFQVLEGSIDFSIGDTKRLLKQGSLLSLEQATLHDVAAVKDSIILLTIIQPR